MSSATQPVLATPAGGSVPFALVSDLGDARDWSQIADWCADGTENRGTLTQFIADALNGNNGRITHRLKWAAGLIESAALNRAKYLITDLQALIYQPPIGTPPNVNLITAASWSGGT